MSTGAPSPRLITAPFVIVTAAAALFFVYIGMLIPLVPLFIEGPLGGGEFGIGLTVAVFAVSAIAVRPWIGQFADRFGRRKLIMLGAVIAAVGGGIAGQVDALPGLLALRALTGIGEAAVFVGAATLIADLSPPERRAESASYFSVAVFGGIGIGPIVGEWVLGDDNFGRAFAIAALFSIGAGLVASLLPRRVPRTEPAAAPRRGLARWLHPAAVWSGVVLACGVVAFTSFTAFLPDYSRTIGLSGAGALFAAYSAVTLLVRVFGARLPERIGPRRMVTIGLGCLIAGMLMLALLPYAPALWVASVVMGLGIAFNYPSLLALTVNRVSEDERAAAVSSFTMFFEIGSVAGGLLVGALAQAVGKQHSFFAGAVSAVIGLWVLRTHVVPLRPTDDGPEVEFPSESVRPIAGD
ncbi:MAG: MFS transporter [Ilumatobacteraceae bacterium]|nr:MFS transporter [Ilumatobacteraceae bacterium]